MIFLINLNPTHKHERERQQLIGGLPSDRTTERVTRLGKEALAQRRRSMRGGISPKFANGGRSRNASLVVRQQHEASEPSAAPANFKTREAGQNIAARHLSPETTFSRSTSAAYPVAATSKRMAATVEEGTARKPVYVNAGANVRRLNSGNEVGRDTGERLPDFLKY